MARRSSHRRRRRKRLSWGAALLIIAVLIIADRQGWLLVPEGDDMTLYHGSTAPVTRVIDGDTLEIDLPDPQERTATTRIRLWGLDCPEMARFGDPAEPWAQAATEYTRDTIEHTTITLWLEPTRTRGTFNRIIAHVELPDGTMLNDLLLQQGLAEADERWPHSFLTRYAQSQYMAQRAEAGLWAED